MTEPSDCRSKATSNPTESPTPMIATRYQNSATNLNSVALIGILNDPTCVEVRFFASPMRPTRAHSISDGSENILPLLAAVASYVIPHVCDVHVVFDGMFLTATHSPRYGEVRAVLDAAQACGKASYCATPVPFTSALSAEKAAEVLLQQGPIHPLTAATRKDYFKLLSYLSEEEYSL